MAKAVQAPKKKRRRRDRDASQKKLLDAALRIFALHGYDGATTKAIAEEAGVAEALIQRYFDGKQGLLLALIKDFGEGEVESCTNLPPKAKNLEAEIKSLLSNALTHCIEKKEYLKVVIPRAVVDRAIGKELAKFLETARAPTLAERLKQHLSGPASEGQDTEAMAYGLALAMISVGFFGQIVMKLDAKLLDRIVTALSQGFAGRSSEI